MANVRHSSLTGSDLHEPKSVATASDNETYVADGVGSGTWKEPEPKGVSGANSGDVYIADGAGSGSWLPFGGAEYGEMAITNNSTAISLTAASDGTLNTDSDYTKVDSGLWTSTNANGVTFDASGYLLIDTTGLYEVSFWCSSFVAATGTNLYAFKYSTDDTNTTLSPRKIKRQSNNAGDYGAIAASGYVNLTAGDKVSMWVACDASTNFTIEDGGLTVVLLDAT